MEIKPTVNFAFKDLYATVRIIIIGSCSHLLIKSSAGMHQARTVANDIICKTFKQKKSKINDYM